MREAGFIWTSGVAVALVMAACPALGQPVFSTTYGIEFSHISDIGNAPYAGASPFGFPHFHGRGSVGYEYRLARKEVSTSQWMEFVNTFSVQGSQFNFFAIPNTWGAARDLTYTGPGRRYHLDPDLPFPAEMGVFGISWREAAMYANWLHNGKSSDIQALATGAYDTSTWGWNPITRTYTDDQRHLPGARFWVPTADEWMKAAHWDPDMHAPGEGGWWDYPNGSNEVPVPGTPPQFPIAGLPVGNTSAGFFDPQNIEWIPLGSYEDMQSPWGLWDTTGAAREWTEDYVFPELQTDRFMGGAGLEDQNVLVADHVSVMSSLGPDTGATASGLRIASIVPGSASALVLGMGLLFARRTR